MDDTKKEKTVNIEIPTITYNKIKEAIADQDITVDEIVCNATQEFLENVGRINE